MRIASRTACATFVLVVLPSSRRPIHPRAGAVEPIAVNDNRVAAGALSNGVLTIRLEVRVGEWHPDRDSDSSLIVHAFAEEGRPMQIPGPLIRVPEGTKVHASVRNTLSDSTVVIHGLSARGTSTPMSADTIQIMPGAVREVRFDAGQAGTYYYWATTNRAPVTAGDTTATSTFLARPFIDAELSGAFIVDPRGTVGPPRDRIFVINLWDKTPREGGVIATTDVLRFTINGKTWPNTERLTYALGDTVHFRVVNPSFAPHPMHLHGFYFNVESRGDGMRDTRFDPNGSKHLVVTERVPPGRTFTMSWVPDRPGYWLFHCHDNAHALRSVPLDGSPLPPEQDVHVHNHALEMMGGLVMGIEVRGNGVTQAASEPVTRRKLRLVARVDSGGTLLEPAYGYVLQDGATAAPARVPLLPAPTILLKRGEPVSIAIVNELPEATSVHWHGIELEAITTASPTIRDRRVTLPRPSNRVTRSWRGSRRRDRERSSITRTPTKYGSTERACPAR
jgi:FtsP/CotA-like multicopper oxidase with cupredoxin domain